MEERQDDKEAGTSAEALARELHGILHHPRAPEILANDWVQDSTLPIPSVRAVLLLFSLLEGADPDPPETITGDAAETVLPLLKQLPPATLREVAEHEASLHQSDKLRFHGSRAYEWSSVLRLFYHLSGGRGVERDVAARVIARRFLDAIVLRAVLHRDTAALRGLADAVEGSAPQPPVTNRIASEICGWQPRLSRELGRELTKGAMKAFLTEMYPYFAEANATTWSDAWKLAGWSTENDRKGPRNNDDATAIARRLK